jgi:hypothetical protein
MSQAKSNVVRTIVFTSVGILLGCIVAYILLQHQAESVKYLSLVREIMLYEDVIELLDNDNPSVAKQRMIGSLEKASYALSGCLNSFCADGKNEHYKQVYESSYKMLQKIKEEYQ